MKKDSLEIYYEYLNQYLFVHIFLLYLLIFLIQEKYQKEMRNANKGGNI